MLSMRNIRENPSIIKKDLKKRGEKEKIKWLQELLDNDKKWRKTKQDIDTLRHNRNKVSKEISDLLKQKKDISKKKKQAKLIPKKISSLEEKSKKLKQKIDYTLMRLPNILDRSVPIGKDETENKQIRKWGKKPKITKPLSHLEIGEKLGILDIKTATKITGSGFYILKKELAILERALIYFMMEFHRKKGRIEVCTPILANPKTAEGTAHLPKFDRDMYKTREGFYLIPTAEMTLTNLHREEVFNESDLPKRYYAQTPCFRTEAGKHGTETRGLFRLHQFNKVEMVTLCNPNDNEKELKKMLLDAEEILKKLEVPYQVIILCSGDTGFKETITYDIETWSPFLKKYMETSSVSSCTDFQARRMNTRYRNNKTKQNEYVFSLNGSGLALPRLMIALIENNQQKDGSIKIPSVLHKYTKFKKISPK